MFAPLLTAASPIPLHGIAAIFAFFLGALQFLLPKGTSIHRTAGYLWVVTMTFVALTSFFINEFRWVGPFGPIHLLSILVLISLYRAVRHARHGRIGHHRTAMISTYVFGLMLAGAFTFLPGRIMHDVLMNAISR